MSLIHKNLFWNHRAWLQKLPLPSSDCPQVELNICKSHEGYTAGKRWKIWPRNPTKCLSSEVDQSVHVVCLHWITFLKVWSYCSPFLSLNFHSRAKFGCIRKHWEIKRQASSVQSYDTTKVNQGDLTFFIFKTYCSVANNSYSASSSNICCDTCMYLAHLDIWVFCRQALSMRCYWL